MKDEAQHVKYVPYPPTLSSTVAQRPVMQIMIGGCYQRRSITCFKAREGVHAKSIWGRHFLNQQKLSGRTVYNFFFLQKK